MVNIHLPVEITVTPTSTEIGVIGECISYIQPPLKILTTVHDGVQILRSLIQFKDRKNEPPLYVDVRIDDKFIEYFSDILTNNNFHSNTSIEELYLIHHLSAGLAAELSKELGLNAIGSSCEITTPDTVCKGIAEKMFQALTESELLRNYIYEQFFAKSADRFFPGKDDIYKPIPFEPDDRLSFHLQLDFSNTRINNEYTFHTWLQNTQIPIVKFIVEFHFIS